MKTIQIPAILCGINTKADRSLSMRFNSSTEYSPEEAVIILGYLNTEGYLLFRPNEFQDSEVPKKNTKSDLKSPSTRLRDVLFVYYKQNKNKCGDDFDAYYRKKMESIITMVKEKLDVF